MRLFYSIIFTVAFVVVTAAATATTVTKINLGRAYASELFTTKIEAQMFNWTFGQPEQFQYRATLKGYPDLPGWMRYMYSNEYTAGYLYGTPPPRIVGQNVYIDVVGLNKLNYETKRLSMSLHVAARNSSSSQVNTVHLKIDNLNWVHLMDPGRVENLKNIFKYKLIRLGLNHY